MIVVIVRCHLGIKKKESERQMKEIGRKKKKKLLSLKSVTWGRPYKIIPIDFFIMQKTKKTRQRDKLN
jgi:hypothetical protein